MLTGQNTREEAISFYQEYWERKGTYRNDLLYNPEVLLQYMAYDISIISALRLINIKRETAKILDVGCGEGWSLINFIRLKFNPVNLFGIDIMDELVVRAKERFPNINFLCGDASCMAFPNNSFDVVTESTMFMQITDQKLSHKIAKEILRVVNDNGYIILADWRYSSPWDNYMALSKKRICALFGVGTKTIIYSYNKGMIIPPVGRFVSKRFPCLYLAIQKCLPFLVGQMAIVLKKI